VSGGPSEEGVGDSFDDVGDLGGIGHRPCRARSDRQQFGDGDGASVEAAAHLMDEVGAEFGGLMFRVSRTSTPLPAVFDDDPPPTTRELGEMHGRPSTKPTPPWRGRGRRSIASSSCRNGDTGCQARGRPSIRTRRLWGRSCPRALRCCRCLVHAGLLCDIDHFVERLATPDRSAAQ
jgi:hypothetical protein